MSHTQQNNFGYACINMALSEVKPKKNAVTTNRSMIRRTFLQKGVTGASELALKNVKDLEKIIQWNEKNKFKFFRMSSDMFPWASEYDFDSMPDIVEITKVLKRTGEYVIRNGHRITFHPGPFNKLCANKEQVVRNTIKDLEIHGQIFDLMGLTRSPYNKINIHVCAAYDDKSKTLEMFCRNFHKLADSVKTRLTVENDDKPTLYSVCELYEGIYKRIQIPIVFDYHHHTFCHSGQSEREALSMAIETWGETKPVVHYSETKTSADGSKYYIPQAHSDFIYNDFSFHGHTMDIMVEAKQKERAVQKYLKRFVA